MTWLPGWDSVESAGTWSHFWFWFGIVCLFALGASEVVSHLYGLRKDELVSIASRVAEGQRQSEADTAKANVDALQVQLSEASQKVIQLQKYQAQRAISDTQKSELLASLRPYGGQKVAVASIIGDSDGKALGEDFAKILEQAGWDHRGDAGISYHQWDVDPVGIEVTVHQVNATQGEGLPAAIALKDTLSKLGLLQGGSIRMSSDVPSGEIQLRIGRKTPP